jgi:hypothetical protein
MKKFLQVITFMGMAGLLLVGAPVFADEELRLFARSVGNSASNQFHLLDPNERLLAQAGSSTTIS